MTSGTLLDRGFWNPVPSNTTQDHYARAIDEWQRRGLVSERRVLAPGDTIDMGDKLAVDVLVVNSNGLIQQLSEVHPEFLARHSVSENDFSIGVKLTLGDFEWFGAGDLSGNSIIRYFGPVAQAYTDVESYVAEAIGAVEVYRVNHHGSVHSSNPCFVQVLHPLVSVISTGINRFGHPADHQMRLPRWLPPCWPSLFWTDCRVWKFMLGLLAQRAKCCGTAVSRFLWRDWVLDFHASRRSSSGFG